MPTPELGKLERVPVREAWPSEAAFNAWLAENLDLLGQAVSIELELLQEEAWLTGWPRWTGRVDILAKAVEDGGYVVIESQMEESDNDHFAGVLNYASHSDARILILVAGELTDWHRRTMDWLNDVGGIQIYGVEMSAWRHGDQMDHRLNLVAGPNKRSEWSGYEFPADKRKYLDFFRPLVTKLHQQGMAERNVARPVNDQAFPSGFTGIEYHVGFWSGPSLDVYLWIATWDTDWDRSRIRNKQIFDALYQHRKEIEKELPGIGWGRRDSQRMSAIYFSNPSSISDSEAKLAELRTWASDTLSIFKAVMQPYLEQVIIELQTDSPETTQ